MAVANNIISPADVITIPRERGAEVFINIRPLPHEAISGVCARFATALRQASGSVVMMAVFGPTSAYEPCMAALREACGSIDWPVTWLQGGVCDGAPIAGIQAHCLRDVPVNTLYADGRAVGRTFDDGYANYALLGDLRPDQCDADQGTQALQLLNNMHSVLQQCGMQFADIARTWLYPDRILDWYGVLNTVRTRFFWDHGIFDRMVPASTGIGGANAFGGAIVGEAFAIKPHSIDIHVKPVISPLQCSARDYGSSFSRAVQVSTPDLERLFVSGTASIEPGGRTVHVDDVVGQITLTFRVIQGILESRCMGFEHVTRAIAYFKHASDAVVLDDAMNGLGLPAIPMVVVESDVCRDDLLFEVELDAVRCNG